MRAAMRAVRRNNGRNYPQGILVPVGSLDRWYGYLHSGDTTRRSMVTFGDSTTWGANDDGSGQHYSWLQRIRDRAVAYGLPDGGKGIFDSAEQMIVYDAPEVNGFVSRTFTSSSDSFDNLAGGFYLDPGTTASRNLVLQFRTTSARLWYEQRPNAGAFTYSVDGGAAVTVNANGTGPVDKFVYITGLSAGTTHTITVTNLDGRPATPPASSTVLVQSFGTGTNPAGTVYYVVTYTFGGGETVASPVASATLPSTCAASIQVPDIGQDGAKLYKGTSGAGPFGLMSGLTPTVAGGVVAFTDNGSVSPTMGTNPPTTGTTNLNTSAKYAQCTLAPVNDTGLSVQKHAISGATFVNSIHGGLLTFTGSANATRYQTPLGLVGQIGSTSVEPVHTIDTSHPVAERVAPVLAVLALGFNDLTNQTSTTDYSTFVGGVRKFAAACRAAGCDAIVTSGQLPRNDHWPTYGAGAFAAMRDTALEQGLPFVDMFVPIGGQSLDYTGGTATPHLTRAQYIAQADYMWDNVLAPA